MKAARKPAIALVAAMAVFFLSACMTSEAEAGESSTIREFTADSDRAKISASRYSIVIHSGAGIPGTPGADQYYRKPREVLQAIVDTCKLGSTVYTQATDGVSVLYILDNALAQSKVDCVKSAEDNGIRLSDSGAGQ
ncbi:MAG: hypothetical protein ABJ242_10215 [Marinomonas sp.]